MYQRSEDYDNDNSDEDASNFILTKKQKKNKAKLNKQKNFKNNSLFSKKFVIENNKPNRKILRSIFDLEKVILIIYFILFFIPFSILNLYLGTI